MDSKNVIAAIALSSAVIVLWSLFFIPEQQTLEFLEANPPGTRSSVRAISSLENNGYAEFSIDPTRGSLLSLILQNPGFF